MTVYASLAHYYDLENAAFTEDLSFWFELADRYGAPILEIGCGTGRVMLPLVQRGYAVVGIDNSPEMLRCLEDKITVGGKAVWPTPPVWVSAEMQEFTVLAPEGGPQLFRLAIVPFNTFMHLLTSAAQMAALRCWRRHLLPGAGLALDLPNPGEVYAAPEQGLMLERTFPDGEAMVQQFSWLQLDRAAQLAHITWLYDVVAREGNVKRLVVPMTLRYTFPAEMRLLLEVCGFRLVHLYGNYDGTPFADGQPRMLVVAEATESKV